VLFDSREANIAFYNAILKKFRRPPLDPAAVEYVHSHTFLEAVQYLFREADNLEEVLAFCRTLDYRPFIPLMVEEPYLRDFLTFLRPRFYTALPHPESFWRILQHFGLKPEEAIYIGDSPVDEEFARNAGVPLVAYRNPALQAAYYLESFAEAPALIDSLAG